MKIIKAFLTDDAGKYSMMRLLTFAGFIVGTILITAGIFAMFSIVPEAGVAILAGTGLCSAGEVAKSLQKKFER